MPLLCPFWCHSLIHFYFVIIHLLWTELCMHLSSHNNNKTTKKKSCCHLLLFSFIILFYFIALVGSKKILLWFMSMSVLLMFSSKSFIVSGLTFIYLSILSLFLCTVLGSVLISFFYTELSSFPSNTYFCHCIFLPLLS